MEYRKCAAQHMGFWMVNPHWLAEAVELFKAGLLPMTGRPAKDALSEPLYAVDAGGVGHVSIRGQMTKGESSFGGTSTVKTRQAIREAAADKAVKGLLLHIDSPGGTAAGTQALAADVAAFRMIKPLYAHIEDEAASAAYWVASQATRVTADPGSLVGSIGTVAVVKDYSGAYQAEGIKVHVIATGPYKGAFAPGAEVTADHLDYAQDIVNDLNVNFLANVADGRRRTLNEVKGWADGRLFVAEKAVGMGMVDAVQGLDATMAGGELPR